MNLYIEYIANHQKARLKRVGMHVFVHQNISIEVDGMPLIDNDIEAFLTRHGISYYQVIGKLNGEAQWIGTLQKLKANDKG